MLSIYLSLQNYYLLLELNFSLVLIYIKLQWQINHV